MTWAELLERDIEDLKYDLEETMPLAGPADQVRDSRPRQLRAVTEFLFVGRWSGAQNPRAIRMQGGGLVWG